MVCSYSISSYKWNTALTFYLHHFINAFFSLRIALDGCMQLRKYSCTYHGVVDTQEHISECSQRVLGWRKAAQWPQAASCCSSTDGHLYTMPLEVFLSAWKHLCWWDARETLSHLRSSMCWKQVWTYGFTWFHLWGSRASDAVIINRVEGSLLPLYCFQKPRAGGTELKIRRRVEAFCIFMRCVGRKYLLQM